MKGYVLLDIPKGCHECRIMFMDECSCWCPPRQNDAEDFNDYDVYEFVKTRTKPDWCPVREFPNSNGYVGLFVDGYDQCLDDILKSEEDL